MRTAKKNNIRRLSSFVMPLVGCLATSGAIASDDQIPLYEGATPPNVERAHIDRSSVAKVGYRMPRHAKRCGESGVATVVITVSEDGTGSDPQISKSSGFPDIDAAANWWASTIHYLPATKDGQAIKSRVVVEQHFTVTGKANTDPQVAEYCSSTMAQTVKDITEKGCIDSLCN